MGSVTILFLPLLLPFLSIILIADKFGFTVNDVILAPFAFILEMIVKVFFAGDADSFMAFWDSCIEKFLAFFNENEEGLVAASEKIAEMLSNIF